MSRLYSLPMDVAVYCDDTAPARAVVVRLEAEGNAIERPLHVWEARNMAKALAVASCDPVTAAAVCGLMGGAA